MVATELIFPTGQRAEPAPELIAAIERTYGLGSVRASRDLGGSYQLNLWLETHEGPLVARVYRPWMTAARLLAIQTVKEHLAATGLPVSLPIATMSGYTMMTYSSRLVEVEPFVAHDACADSWERYEAAFALLGRFHRATTRIDATTLPPPRVQNDASLLTLLQWVAYTEQRLHQQSAEQQLLAVCDDATDLLQQIHRKRKMIQGRKIECLTHGDFGGDNLIFHGNAPAAILDFDFMAVRERVFDLAYALFWMFERLEGQLEPAQRSWQHMDRIIRQYEANSAPLSDAERQCLPLEMARVPLYWIGEAGTLTNPARQVSEFAPAVACSRWILEHLAA